MKAFLLGVPEDRTLERRAPDPPLLEALEMLDWLLEDLLPEDLTLERAPEDRTLERAPDEKFALTFALIFPGIGVFAKTAPVTAPAPVPMRMFVALT